ncbi:hypothetical protein CHELA1G11_11130 [Hyphomicrobiales bacterium]|nr:hypothetical protein CHELA1G11_11130 [Hyphomicrobiales bacterium]CAH1669927.1 hypothetical protein CHELA1G2_13180 [Hyphomicrobiales bacterium]
MPGIVRHGKTCDAVGGAALFPVPSRGALMPMALLTESLGALAAALTTLCWLPQAIRIIRTRDTRALSLITQVVFACGVFLWLGSMDRSWGAGRS